MYQYIFRIYFIFNINCTQFNINSDYLKKTFTYEVINILKFPAFVSGGFFSVTHINTNRF